MRRLRTPLMLSGFLIAAPSFAQGVQPADVKLDEQPAAKAPAAQAPAAQAPAAKAPAAQAPAAQAPAAPPAAAPAAAAEAKKDTEKPKKVEDTRAATGSVSGPATPGDETWRFGYNGYFRAPMRVGISTRTPAAGQSKMTLHSPLIPDDQYLSWQHTKHANRDWAELYFSYGNSWAKGIVGIEGYNFVEATSQDWKSNFGVAQGYVEITPYIPAENVRLKMKAGSFWNRYGGAGRWDAGEYDTFIFGRTHTMGETTRVEIDLEGQPITLGFEHGIGTKKPDPSIYNTARFTLLDHFHADLMYDQTISFGLHFLDSWSQTEPQVTGPQPTWVYPGPYPTNYQGINQPDGSMKVFGGEMRFDMPDVFGYLYAGASYISLKNAVTIAPAIEVIHSQGGGEFNMGVVGNYLDSEACRWASATAGTCSNGNGGVMTLEAQYEEKVGDLLGESPFGDGQDLTVKLYGMWNKVKSDDPINDGITKLKFGTDLIFDVFPVMAVAARADYLMPNSRIKKQNFGILSPHIILRSSFVTHEQIIFQYSRYFYAQRECVTGTPGDNPTIVAPPYGPNNTQGTRVETPFPGAAGNYPYEGINGDPAAEAQCAQPPPSAVTPDGWGASTQNGLPQTRGMPYTGPHLRPDVNVFTVEANMWW